MKRTMIGGQYFEVINGKEQEFAMYSQNDYSDSYDKIHDVYGRPSQAKVEIWHEWWVWAHENNAIIRIGSHNCNFFSIYGTVYTNNGTYNLWITASHNRAYPVNAR